MALAIHDVDALVISEIFGPTVQGEGFAAGRHCMFVRLGNCNLECTWCDTPYTWAFSPQKAAKHQSGKQFSRREQLRTVDSNTVLKELFALQNLDEDPTMIVISGGEPLMQQGIGMIYLLRAFDNLECPVHIETAGTIEPTRFVQNIVTQFNVSPKLEHSGNIRGKRYKPQALTTLLDTGKARFKFVIQQESDLEEVQEIVDNIQIPSAWVQVMAEGVTNDTLKETMTPELADKIVQRGWGISPRLHIALWKDVRGK